MVFSKSTKSRPLMTPIEPTTMKIANDKNILGNKVNGRLSNVIGWSTVIIMGISVGIMLLTFTY